MNRCMHPGRGLAALVLALFSALAFAQAQPAAKDYEPSVGQAGKDVVWVPTSQALVDKMLDLAKVTPADVLMDLGSGDGRTVITAAKRGLRATGIEYNPDMVELSKRNAAQEGVTDRATFMKADLFETDLSKATVITMHLLPDINLKLRPRILDLKSGTRIVSNSFTMDDWVADQIVTASDGCETWCTALLWIVPAKVEGVWQLAKGGKLKPAVLDPQGKAIQHSLEALGFAGVEDVRVGKVFRITMNDGSARETIVERLEQMAQKLLANPIVENYKVDVEG